MFLIINGPNLNLLGKREPGIYGNRSFEDYLEQLREEFPGTEIEYFQSNCEGAIIDTLQLAEKSEACQGVVINPGAYSHYSLAIADAIAAMSKPVVEVHISNIHAREPYRHNTVTGARARGVIAGFGLSSYRLALLSLLS